jgi:hypothetical protein
MVLSPEGAIELMTRMLAVSACLGAVQALVLVTQGEFGRGGAMDIRITASRPAQAVDRLVLLLVHKIPASTALVVLVASAIQGCASIMVFLFPKVVWPLATTLVIVLVLRPVFGWGLDKADVFLRILLVATVFHAAAKSNNAADVSCVLFIAGVTCLVYIGNGFSKAQSQAWWDGTGLAGVIASRYFGARQASRWASPRMTKPFGLFVLMWESIFPVALVVPVQVAIGILVIGVVFHAGCAVVMGLDGFLWTFPVGYPCVIAANMWIARHLSVQLRVSAAALLALGCATWLVAWHAMAARTPRSTPGGKRQ